MKTTQKRAGKGPRSHPKETWYASRGQFCAVTGRLPQDVKRAGLDPFAGKEYFKVSRVSSRLTEWLDANPAPAGLPMVSEKEQRQAEKIEKEIRKLDFEHQLTLGKYELKDKVKESFAKSMEAVQKVLLTFLDKTTYNKVIREMKRELEAIDL